ncbi:DUF4351 domain-containing protein [Nocardia sp. NEAU-G5]|uniref:DUF4351 domain-containing protein n=1 Tax=Nocardia albiluteola TaxID=2842303 RepID=A0ABS6ASM5_9NOCA|nr:DUF4351 domain-containing protein [Nocardia albiluteola]MBU3059999.1 DUF4351 domain-containing protein [Nocardia albiluteola]
MPTLLHEGLVDIFKSRPELATWFLEQTFGVSLPEYKRIHAEPCDFTDTGPKEFRGDVALALNDRSGKAVAGISVEVQLGRDKTRHFAWPVYVATLRARLQCPTYLLVIAPRAPIARLCRLPIELGHPGLVLRPLVLGPELIPELTDPAEAIAEPERAVLSGMAHGDGPNADAVLNALLAGLSKTDTDRGLLYTDLVTAVLSRAGQRRLEELMATTYEYQSNLARKYVEEGREKGRQEGRQEGRAQGEARMLLRFLGKRGITVTEDVEARIMACTDREQIERWADKVDIIDSADELFE